MGRRQLSRTTHRASHPMSTPAHRVLIDQPTIQRRVEGLAGELVEAYGDRDLTVVAIMRGSLIFLADLVRLLPMAVRIEVIAAESYGSGTESSGQVRMVSLSDVAASTRARHVLLLDDILDTGRTLAKVCAHIQAQGPKSLRTCVLLDKPARRAVDFEADFRGFTIDDHFVVGYGLDLDGEWRHLPYVAVVEDRPT